MKIRIENVETAKAAEIANLVRAYNRTKREPSTSEALNIYLEDSDGSLLAGVVAETFGNWLEIEYLYVAEDMRSQGIGSKILIQAEEEARKRGCKYVFVDTFDFQAPAFYEKHGYQEVFALREYPFTGRRHYYTKVL